MEVLLALIAFALVMAFPVLVIALWVRVSSLEAKVARLTANPIVTTKPSVTAAGLRRLSLRRPWSPP